MIICTRPRQAVLTNTDQVQPLAQTGFGYRLHSRIEHVAAEWHKVVPEHDFFMHSSFLQLLEDAPPAGMNFRYMVIFRDYKPCGVLYFQIRRISLSESINHKEKSGLGMRIRNWVKGLLSFNTLVCGSLIVSGEHGWAWDESIPNGQRAELIKAGIEATRCALRRDGQRISLLFVKDFKEKNIHCIRPVMKQAGYHELTAQPCMEMEIRPNWTKFDDYLADLASKYRIRAKRAIKKSTGLVRQELSEAEIESHKDRIYELYEEVISGIGFNTFKLNVDYFVGLKHAMGDRFKVFGYFDGDKLVAFYSIVFYGDRESEGHFLGLDHSYNHSHQAYLNILYDLLRVGIYHQCRTMNCARTALEIKSSVGAEPHMLYTYVRTTNWFLNLFVGRVYNYMTPDEPWVQRHPFKDDGPETEG